ncbi:hypothetical protein ABDK00_006565 [Niabella insulamsoli]|uniref:hypothetical protein n=1 Tax=Niabella insulamsoli TaxID=3144874 RepID=UPI0031FD081D
MFKPFKPFNRKVLNFLRSLKRRFVVIQTLEPLPEQLSGDESKAVLMLTDYDALAHARAHKNAISDDKYAVIFDLENDSQRTKLEEMTEPGSKYVIYSTCENITAGFNANSATLEN